MVVATRRSPLRRGKDTLQLLPFSVHIAVDLSDLVHHLKQSTNSKLAKGALAQNTLTVPVPHIS